MGIDTNRYSWLIDSWLGFRGYLSVLFTLDTMYTIMEYFLSFIIRIFVKSFLRTKINLTFDERFERFFFRVMKILIDANAKNKHI